MQFDRTPAKLSPSRRFQVWRQFGTLAMSNVRQWLGTCKRYSRLWSSSEYLEQRYPSVRLAGWHVSSLPGGKLLLAMAMGPLACSIEQNRMRFMPEIRRNFVHLPFQQVKLDSESNVSNNIEDLCLSWFVTSRQKFFFFQISLLLKYFSTSWSGNNATWKILK